MNARRFPHSLVLIVGMIVVAQLATVWLRPGTYEREPTPNAGTAYDDVTLGARLKTARDQRDLPPEEVGALFGVSGATVLGWEADQKSPAATHVEAGVGALVDAWVKDASAVPSDDERTAWASAVESRRRVVPGTFSFSDGAQEASAVAETDTESLKNVPLDVLMAIPKGLTHEESVAIIMFVFVVGGVIAVLRATGAIDALIGTTIERFASSRALLIAMSVTLFAVGSSTIGMAEEYMPFVPILVTMCIALKMDAVLALGLIYVGAGVGYGAAAVNPFTVLIAQDIAGLAPTSGSAFRWIFLVACLAVSIHHLLRYAKRIVADPSRSLVRDIDFSQGFDLPEDTRLTARRMGVLALFIGGIVLLVWGVKNYGWYFAELNAIFLAIAVASMIVGGVGLNRAADAFCRGAAEMTTTALLIGFARTIEVVLTDAQVIDTVIHTIAGPLSEVGRDVSVIGMLGVQCVCNFFIPSGSGQAYVTMPIMAPLADVTGVPRQVAVLAYQMGDGFTNMIVPTNALLMGMLALGRIPYQRWVQFVLPLLLKLFALSIVFLLVAVRWFGS